MNRSVIVLAALAAPGIAIAAPLELRVTVENLVAPNGIAFAPLNVAFHNGTFDAFDLGHTATPGIMTVAETGSGANWFAALHTADPGAVSGTILPLPLLSGAASSATFTIDPGTNPYFSFAAMALPSNDFFIGNDAPMAFRLFDAGGTLQTSEIVQHARDLWDAGSEVFNPATAAFLAVGNAALRADQNSVVARNFAELAAFNGLTTGAGYVLDSTLAADTPIYRISFDVVKTSPVPLPGALPMMLGALGIAGGLRRRDAS